jgi:hypothetical protein
MRKSIAVVIVAALLSPLSQAKDKEKEKPTLLPPTFLRAHTIAVTIDPDAGISPTDPNANQTAQKDVEVALTNWGRFVTTLDAEHADLVVILHKSSGKLATGTVTDPRQNNRVGGVTRTDDNITIMGRTPPPGSAGPSSGSGPSETPHPQAQINDTNDSFIVEDTNGYRWRYDAKDALHHHDVPAVDKFRKAIEEAEKAAANTAPKNQPAQPSTSPAPGNSQPGNPYVTAPSL